MTDSELLAEKVFVTKHRRSPTQMAILKRGALLKNGCSIQNHDTLANGTHEIVYVTGKKNVRVCEISTNIPGRNRTKITDRPGNNAEKTRYGAIHQPAL